MTNNKSGNKNRVVVLFIIIGIAFGFLAVIYLLE
ncbi:MAG: hypothetical protein ACJAWN_001866 [Neolewinella sp.]|jgi:hypothetical protein